MIPELKDKLNLYELEDMDYEEFRDVITGFENLAYFILNNPNVNYVFISSTSADSEVIKHSLYGLSKYIAENIFLKVMEYNPKINIHFIRLGMIYGLEDCPIRKILFLLPRN